MLDRPRYFAFLFPLSAVFWWFFEYLNRFVQNWHYVGGENFDAWEYFWYATLPYSTVLPAVLSTREWLSTFFVFDLTQLRKFSRVRRKDAKEGRKAGTLNHGDTEARRGPLFSPVLRVSVSPWFNSFIFATSRLCATTILFLSALALVGIGVFPNHLYPLVWIAPLLILVSLQMLQKKEHIFSGIERGDWHLVITSALAALICGFFWEMWNYYSLARWEYSIPFVNRFHIFEMPILGYAGYLPFGMTCAAIDGLITADQTNRSSVHGSPVLE